MTYAIQLSEKTYKDFSDIHQYLKALSKKNNNGKVTHDSIIKMFIDNHKNLLEEARIFMIGYDKLLENKETL